MPGMVVMAGAEGGSATGSATAALGAAAAAPAAATASCWAWCAIATDVASILLAPAVGGRSATVAGGGAVCVAGARIFLLGPPRRRALEIRACKKEGWIDVRRRSQTPPRLFGASTCAHLFQVQAGV
jgi:hypothetical protein